MPKDAQVTLISLLGMLEDMQNSSDDAVYSTIHKNHINLLKSFNTVLSTSVEVTKEDADRVLKMCLKHKTDVRFVPYVLSIISTLINVDKKNSLEMDFLPSALATLAFLKTMCILDKTSSLLKLSLQVLMSHPKSTLKKLVGEHSPAVIETFGHLLALNSKETIGVKIESFTFIGILEWLPAHEKSIFIKEGIPLWLSRVIPMVVEFLVTIVEKEILETCLYHVELLTKELVQHDYFNYPEWEALLESIVDPKKFPACIKIMLDKNEDTWHRIWIVIIKILKSHVTRHCSPFGTPINSMLPVVEKAFKGDSMERVHAFTCWNELIINFSNETNPSCISKRIKLVMIPLRLNNAKTEETAIAKFQTWWLFIRKFTRKIEDFTDEILIPFLHFMFGKDEKTSFRAVQLSATMRRKCLESFTEILGHLDCSCKNTNVEALNEKIITTILLTDHWKDFVFALKAAIRVAAINFTQDTKMNVRCLWNSFLLRLADLADNSLRRDLFENLVEMLSDLVSDSQTDDNLTEILIDDIALALFRDSRVKTLIKSRSETHRPMHKIVRLITNQYFDKYYKRQSPQDLTKLLQPVISSLVTESVTTPAYMIWLLDELPSSDSAFKLWTALVHAVAESDLCLQVINSILRWPFKTVSASSEVQEAASAWYMLYNIVHVKLEKIAFDKEISKVLTRPVEENKPANYFILFALVGVLKHKPDEEKMAKLEALTYEMNSYKDFEQIMPPLIDTLALMIDNVSANEDENVTQITINCVQNVLKVLNSETESSECKSLSKNRDTVFSELRGNSPSINKTMLSNTIKSAMKSYLAKCSNESIKKQIRTLIASLEKTEGKQNTKKIVVYPKEFVSPKVQEVKKTKRKEPSIVSTVLENGEEYVVVKSNWKFNPKKLTENQKEKLQRKRDNIPALYQDLSQSQDEFKLSTWKTDSQDTSLSSSKSATSNDNADILKNMPSAGVVPKIMENMLGNEKNIAPKTDADVPVSKEPLPKLDKLSTPIGAKSPRMALKDRVFRNVRNLIEKSSPSPQKTIIKDTNRIELKSPVPKSKEDNSTERVTESKQKHVTELVSHKQDNQIPTITLDDKSKQVMVVTAKQNDKNITLVCTPIKKNKKDINVTNSAPPQLIADRPARMKRTPKKFDDSLLLAFKKSRQAKNDSQFDSEDSQEYQSEITVVQVHAPKNHETEMEIDTASKIVTKEIDPIKYNSNKAQITTDDDLILLEDEIVTKKNSKDNALVECKKSEETFLISPTTPISGKAIEKSPEKPTTGEVPNINSKASEGIENDFVKIDEAVSVYTPLNNMHVVNQEKTSVQIGSHKIEDSIETLTNSLKRIKKFKTRNKSSSNDTPPTAASTPLTNIEDTNSQKALPKKNALQKDNDNANEKLDATSSPKSTSNQEEDVDLLKSDDKSLVKMEISENVEISDGTFSLSETNKIDWCKLESKIKLEDIKDIKTEEIKDEENVALLTPKNKIKDQKSSAKKTKKSRVEKELMIDTVEGNPFLKVQSEKRITRKKKMEVENTSRRKSLVEKSNKLKLEATPKTSKKPKEKKTSPSSQKTVTVEESQDGRSNSSKEVMDAPPCSEDIIESSQDSTMTTISVKSTKKIPKRVPIVALEKINVEMTETQGLIQDCEMVELPAKENHENTDIEFPKNKTVLNPINVTELIELIDTEPVSDTKNTTDLTENMDTEPLGDNTSEDVIVLSETLPTPITINSEPVVGPETQELAEADTQPNDPNTFIELESFQLTNDGPPLILSPETKIPENPPIDNDITQSLPNAALNLANMDNKAEVSSPFKDYTQRKQDFLNNTLEISPIKIQSPDREKKSPSPETSSDFVVIKLSSPVHCNGERFEKQGSPEFFTEDKVSPDKRDASPPRADITVVNTSPSSSLSLKKNRPQVRPGGRAAQMLGLLCVNSDLKVTMGSDRSEPEEAKKASTSTPARRNLRILYNSVGDNSDNIVMNLPEQNIGEDFENFLKLQRTLPTVTSSPSGPILKRKLVDITDESTTSPASKRKRVSFHDPPVSTSISVHKYIEPSSLLRSPQSSTKKRIEKQTRLGIKSPKRLENAFNLDTVLSKAVESFTDTIPSDDTENISLDITPIVEIIKTSELNDTDPICPELIDCKDPIDVIATKLSSPATRELFVKELEGKIETVGDLARMSELEVNRLCIKAPKIKVTKKVLTDYVTNRPAIGVETVIEEAFSEPMTESLLNESKTASVEMQTDELEVISTEMQTDVEPLMFASTQTDGASTAHISIQTDESGSKTTADIISTVIDREDFLEKLFEKLDDEQLKTVAEKMSPQSMLNVLIKKSDVLDGLLEHQSKDVPKDQKVSAELSFVRDHLFERYDSKDLILLCSQLLQKVYDKPA